MAATHRTHQLATVDARGSIPMLFVDEVPSSKKPAAKEKKSLQARFSQSLATLDQDCDALDLFVERVKGKVQ